MAQYTREGWWYRASTEARLRQIDAGIELGMTAAQIALASGGGRQAVVSFAWSKGRQFGRPAEKRRVASARQGAKASAAAAYLRGEPVDFWRSGPQDSAPRDTLDVIGS